jgi:hypothetical protein
LVTKFQAVREIEHSPTENEIDFNKINLLN